MPDIINSILKDLPDIIASASFEGANIVLYTGDKDFFLGSEERIKALVDKIKKRIELRADDSLLLEKEKTEKFIKEVVPKEAEITDIIFDVQRSIVIIEAKKPGMVIGKGGEILREIRKKTFWLPQVQRSPAIRSQITENIRNVLYLNNNYRKRFLNSIGKAIYKEWNPEKIDEWVRLTFLGSGRQVGRSCLLLHTPESKVLLDCGIDVAAQNKEKFPYLDVSECNIKEIDAIIISHAHLDHSGMVPWLYKMGYRGPCYMTLPTRDISSLLALDYIGVAYKRAVQPLFSSDDIKEMVKHSICLEYNEVTDITPDVRLTFYNAGHALGSSMIHLNIGNGLHNMLYSLDWSTPVTIIDQEENVNFTPIGGIIDNTFKKYSNLITKKGVAEEVPNIDGIKIIAFNPKTYKSEIKKITSFIRHPINEDLYSIKTLSGREGILTQSHSLFSIKEGKLEPTKLGDLRVSDFIIGAKRIPTRNIEPVINLLEYSDKIRIYIDDEELLKKMINKYKKKFNQLRDNDKKEAINWVHDHYKYSLYKKDIAQKYHVHPRRIRRVLSTLGIKEHPRCKHAFPAEFKITKDFARFLGYYVSEGCPYKNSQTLQITNYSNEILEDSYKIIKNIFGIEGDMRYSDRVVLFNSKQLKYLVCEILKCGKNAHNKRVPSNLLLSSKEIISNFLYGYFSGDGGIKIEDYCRSITANTKSKNLIQDITFLLLQFGLVPTIRYNKTTKMYIATIYNSDQIKKFLNEINILNLKRDKLRQSIQNIIQRKASFDLRIPLLALSKKAQLSLSKTAYKNAKSCSIEKLKIKNLPQVDKKLLNSDFLFDQIKEIKKVKPTSSYVYDFKIEGSENFLGGEGFLFFHNTADMKFGKTRLLEPAETIFPRLETVIVESTYGSKNDILPSRKDAEDMLINAIKKTIERKGKVLIPELGLGRSQETMLILEQAVKSGMLEKIPIYIDGMIWDVTAIHTAYPNFLSNVVKSQVFQDNNPFASEVFKRIGSPQERQEVVEGGPCVVLATSGMLVGGASVEYFREFAGSKNNSIVFVCYQGIGSLGRQVQEGIKEVRFQVENREEIAKVNMEVITIDGLTAHSGRNQLLAFVNNLQPQPKRIIINHGEQSKCLDLASTLYQLYRVETSAPRNLETLRLR